MIQSSNYCLPYFLEFIVLSLWHILLGKGKWLFPYWATYCVYKEIISMCVYHQTEAVPLFTVVITILWSLRSHNYSIIIKKNQLWSTFALMWKVKSMTLLLAVILHLFQNIYVGIKDVLSFCTKKISLLLSMKNRLKVGFFFRKRSICTTVVQSN